MSVNMLGVEDGEQEKDDRKEVNLVKSPESSKIKKTSPSIKNFFRPKEKQDNEPTNKKDIKNFFITQNKHLNEKTADVELIQDSDSDENGATNTEKIPDGIPTGSHRDDVGCRAVESVDTTKKQEECGNSSSKKPKPKWSLSWRVAKKSKKDGDDNSDSEDFVELSNDEDGKNNAKKSKRRKSKTGQKEDNSFNKEKTKGTELKDDEKQEKEERRKKRKKKSEVGKISVENDRKDELKEVTIGGECDQKLSKTSKEIIVEKEDRVDLSDISEKKIDTKSPTISSDNQTKPIKSAFDVLMSPTKSHIVDDNEKSKESITIEDISSPTCIPDQKNEEQPPIDCGFKGSPSKSPGSGNAFDVLMTKKKQNENSSDAKKSPQKIKSSQKSKLNPPKFKLNICYSKPMELEDAVDVGDDADDDDENGITHKAEQKSTGGNTSKKNKKTATNEKPTSTKKPREATNDVKPTQIKKKSNSQTHSKIDQSHEKLSSKITESDIVDITYISEETLELVEEPQKMTKVKKNKKNKTRSKSAGTEAINVKEDSNPSVQELSSSDAALATPKTGAHCSKSEIISPGSDDFEIMPTRKGLRKRTPKSYAVMNDPESIVVEDKKKNKKKEKKEEKEIEKDTGSPDVEMVMSCKGTKREKDHKNTEPKNLASIFLKKPKNIEKKDPTTDQTLSTKTSQPKDDSSCNQLNETELKAANMAFTALFSTCRTTKPIAPSVQVWQQPAPWPSVSHVTQKDDDQSDEVFWKLNDSKMETLPWKPESGQEIPRLKTKAIQLGEFTSSLNQDKIPEDKKNRIQNAFPADCLSTVAVKKVLSEVSSYFPGVPIKRLYKQYKNKEEGKKEVESLAETSKEQKKDISEAKDGRKSLDNPEERLQKRRGRPKRKISIESDDDLREKQQKKVPRTKEKEEQKINEKAQEVGNKTESSKRLRKKREREEEEETQNEKNTKRKSSRIQKHSENDQKERAAKNEEKNVENSKRKKRKTMDDNVDAKQVIEKEEKSEDSRSSLDEKRNPDKKDLLWTEKYQPECSSEVMGNASSVSRLRSWLEEWKIKREKTLRKEIEMQKRLLAKQKNKDSSEKKLSWWEEDQDSDFHLSDEDSDDSGNEESGMCNAMLVLGPRGSGKTAAVYACAKELGYKVFEVNCSSKRSNKQILSRLEEATQSHLVITNPSANTPRPTAFGGLFGSLSEKPAASVASSPMSNFFKKSNENQQEKSSKSHRKGGQEKSEKEKERKLKGKEKGEKGKNSAQVLGSTSDSDSMPALSLKAASLILFEEVDVIFEDDKGFWSAVTSFMRNAKCPIIMTSNDSRVDCDGRYEQLMIRSPSVNLLSAHLLITALVNNIFVNPSELKSLASWYRCDIRKCLLALQFWILSGGGIKISWEEFTRVQKDQKQLSDVQGGSEVKADVETKLQKPSKMKSSNQCTVEQQLGLDDPGEESLFLSVDDWKTLAKQPGRASRRGHQSPASTSDFQNEDSDFEPTKPSSQPLTDENTNTDSILDANEPGDSQSMQQLPEHEAKKVPMPDVHCLLVEQILGVDNSTHGYDNGCMGLLKDVGSSSEKDYLFKMRCSLSYDTQKMGFNLVSNNLPTLLPCLHSSRSPSQKPVTMATKEVANSGSADSLFTDKSIFDDGSSVTPKKGKEKNSIETKADSASVSKLTNEDSVKQKSKPVVSMATDENCVISNTLQSTDSKTNKDTLKEFQGEALEMFSGLAEDMSFMDAYIPSIATDTCNKHAAAFGWWHSRVRAGLSDDVITVTKCHDWLTCDTNACIRGALEVASLENSYTGYKILVEKKQKYDGDEDLEAHLPYKEYNSVVNLTGMNKSLSSKLSSRNKLYKSVSSSLPLVTHSTHHVVSMDYLPTIRSICHTERLREQANTKRRFLHYLDSNSLCISKSSQQSMADAFLAPQ